jgi:flagella basal body P-ring formation protein FlgA
MTFTTAIALLATSSSGFASLDEIDREVANFTGAGIGAPGGAVRALDKRLRLRACGSQVALEWHTPRRDTVTVRCPDPGGWTLFVPVMTSSVRGPSAASPAVNRGDPVSLSVSGRSFAVSRPAEALETGAVGQWIRVRPITDRLSAEPALRAQVVRPGQVSLPVG